MKNIALKCLAPAALLGVMALPLIANADTPAHHYPGINARLSHQERRIDQGIHSGQLTRPEVRHLETRDSRIARLAVRDRISGGKFTARERLRLRHRLNRTSHAIYLKKHNSATR